MRPLTQAAIFLALVFTVPWIAGPWLPQQPQNTWEVILSFLPGVWAPTVVALVMIAAIDGRPALRRELAVRFRSTSDARLMLLVAAAVPALTTLAGVLLARAQGDGQPFIQTSAVRNVVLAAVTTGAVGEELGWRGFLLSRLAMRVRPRIAAVVMAVLWMLWHVPAFLFEGSPYSTWPIVPALVAITAFGVFLACLFFRTRASVIPTILAHLSWNITLGLGGAQLSSAVFWWTLAVLFTAITVLLLRRV